MYTIKGQLVLYLGLGDSYGCHWTSLKCIQLLLYLGLDDREWMPVEFIEMYTIKGQLVLYLVLGDSYACHWTSLKCIQSKGNLLLYLGLGAR